MGKSGGLTRLQQNLTETPRATIYAVEVMRWSICVKLEKKDRWSQSMASRKSKSNHIVGLVNFVFVHRNVLVNKRRLNMT